ncbi:MAG: hypothetical protein M1819_005107 [Sarea resinae]|nr:MAG: hypothetical protein M1819_005107 [Sarea resinae]
MGPRKRSKKNPKAKAADETAAPDPSTAVPHEQPSKSSEETDHGPTSGSQGDDEGPTPVAQKNDSQSRPRSTKSWYGGSWPRVSKASPVTQIAKESISAASNTASDVVSTVQAHTPRRGAPRSPSLSLSQNVGSSSRSLPLAATTTKLNITSNASGDLITSTGQTSSVDAKGTLGDQHRSDRDTAASEREANGSTNVENDDKKPEDSADIGTEGVLKERGLQQQTFNTSAGWRLWPFRADNTSSAVSKEESEQQKASSETHPAQPIQETPTPKSNEESGDQDEHKESTQVASSTHTTDSTSQSKSWFGFLGGYSWQSPPTEQSSGEAAASGENATQDVGQDSTDTTMTEAPPEPPKSVSQGIPSKSSGWAFWSREKGKDESGAEDSDGNVGEIAIANTPSQSQPEAAKVPQQKNIVKPEPQIGKRGRPKSLEVAEDISVKSGTLDDSTKSTPSHSPMPSGSKAVEQAATKTLPKSVPNLVLPPFRSTFSEARSSSVLQQISRMLFYSNQPPPKHVNIVRDPPRIKKALAIGVHGYFPAPLIRTVLGQPTGTSLRFANGAAAAIKQWTEDRGYSCEIEKVALEGEGKISERVDLLWKLLLNWMDHIQKADFIMVACHSQGVPVAIMLVAKLIMMGCVSSARIGICAMAGVNLGPFPDYKSRLFSGSAGELFDFARPASTVSRKYEGALTVVIKYGVRITYIGSIDDQLVSLESSTFTNISHPYIYRAVFIDGRAHAPDFLTHLVGFALKLRNLGISDHGLIRELSGPLAGSLYSGEGHSRLYDDQDVYELAIEHSLESSSVGDIPLEVQEYTAPTSANPYILPWSMRGLLEEDYVRTDLGGETKELLEQFDDWKPTSKVLKDVKFRLEAVKSKL